jgi:hypothetical protein
MDEIESLKEENAKLKTCIEKLVDGLQRADKQLGFDGCCIDEEDYEAIAEARALLSTEKKDD